MLVNARNKYWAVSLGGDHDFLWRDYLIWLFHSFPPCESPEVTFQFLSNMLYFVRLKTMRGKQNLASALGIQKENWG